MSKNVLIINQSAELYGADKALLELLEDYPKGYNPIVVLHENGPLKELLLKKNIQVIHSSVIKIRRGILKPIYFLKLPFEIFSSIKTIRKELNKNRIDLVHSNATSVFIGAFYSFVFRIPHIWHVHEIIEKPVFLANLYPKIVSFFSTKIVFNSNASFQNFFKRKKNILSKSIIIYNGQERNYNYLSTQDLFKIRSSYFNASEKDIVFGLVGRINKWKGHLLLLEAFSKIIQEYKNTKLVFIGSAPPNQEFYLDNLISKILDLKLNDSVTIIPFQNEIWAFYDALDICVVPSTEPEPFGLVATEAMLSKKPVIAANHGGLSEIILHNETGLFFNPNDINDLIKKMKILIENPNKISEMGEKGLIRVNSNFSRKNYCKSFESVYNELI